MAITPDEWLDQANYEIESAEYNLKGGRNLYAVYMCHLAIEKALKGLQKIFLLRKLTRCSLAAKRRWNG